MTPVDIKWDYGLYSGQFLSYSTISSWYHFFVTYYNGLKIDNKCTNKNYSSYVEYLENDDSCPYSRESCLILDTKCDEIGGLEAYSFMCDVLFPRYIIKDEDLISYWQTDTLYINDILIPALRKGYTRASNQESDIASDSTTGSAGCITSNTVFTLNFDKPVQKTVIDDLFRNYLLNGTIETYTVKIVEPGFNVNIETTKQMVISEVTRNTETTLNASETITMVEALI
jgi:hypothetical protein